MDGMDFSTFDYFFCILFTSVSGALEGIRQKRLKQKTKRGWSSLRSVAVLTRDATIGNLHKKKRWK